ncbi:hypothetical protein [Roseibium sp.]
MRASETSQLSTIPTAVIAGPDPAIHAVSALQIEVVLRGKVTA